jgi:2,4-dienoyl-CoA reductase-like NADH-dependent reductase (Old Yellow Enzyme family)
VWFRVSCSDQVDTPGSWDLAQTIALAKKLREVGVDLLDCSSSGNLAHAKVGPSNGVSPGYQVPFARAVKAEAKIPVGAVGVITAPAQAEQILNNDNVDVILVGREFMRDPFWGLRAARALGVDLHWTQQYDWAVNLPPKL